MVHLATDKSAYAIGEFTTYSITGAKPNADIAWTSFKNAQPTGELQAQYGQYTDASGNWSGRAAQPWTASEAGSWEKQVLLVNPGGGYDQAVVTFTVGAGQPATSASHSTAGGFLSGSTTLPLVGTVPNGLLIIGAVIAVAALLGGGGGRR